MAEDREILREVWEGRIPVCFSLAPEELFTMEQPDPFYLLVPRQSYFPLVTDKVQRHFVKYIDAEHQGDMWLEYEGQPLRWHYPVGVLFDQYGTEEVLPWIITVHFQNFPSEDLLQCSSKEAVESHFMSTVKEADALKHRGQMINAMQKKDHKQLWLGLQNDKFEQFWSVNRRLMDSTADNTFKYIPFRIYQPDTLLVQRLYKPMSDDGSSHTLRSLLEDTMPELVLNEDSRKHVVIQGIEPPLDTPIIWLSEHFSHPDNFLHICIVTRSGID